MHAPGYSRVLVPCPPLLLHVATNATAVYCLCYTILDEGIYNQQDQVTYVMTYMPAYVPAYVT